MKKIRKILLIILFVVILFPGEAICAVKHGTYDSHYSNGKLRMRMKYKQGKIVSKKIYFRNGKLSQYSKYQERRLIKKKTYYDNGQLQSVWSAKSGVAKYYTKTGELKAIVQDDPQKDLKKSLPFSFL